MQTIEEAQVDYAKLLKQTRLRRMLIQLHVMEFWIIELSASSWLKRAGVNYAALEENAAWVVLIGALISMRKADQCHAVRTSRNGEGVAEAFEGFLRQGIPGREFQTIYNDMENTLASEQMVGLDRLLQDKGGFTEFEASARCIATYVASWVTDNDDLTDKVSEALFQFYLRAADDYFDEDECR